MPSTPLTRAEASARLDDSPAADAQVEAIAALTFQQSINCCGITSVAYALSALGAPTSVDDIFLTVGVDVDSAVVDGMTLAEIYDVAQRFVARRGLPVFVECYHFDATAVTAEMFAAAAAAEAAAGLDDLLILNFHSGIAHGWASGGGGHFSVVAALDEDSGAPGGGDVIMADVHGVKYGEFWASPVAQMWAAAADHDSVGRARGALRFGRTDRDVARPLVGLTPTVLDWASPPPPYTATALRRHIPERWDEGLGVRNMEGASAVAAGMRLLEGDASPLGRLDEVMRALNASYSHHLDTFLPPSEVAAMVKGLAAAGRTAVRASVVTVPAVTAESLRTALVDAGCGEEGVAVLASYEFNRAYGSPLLAKESGEAGALSHGTRAWSVIAAVDAAADGNDVKGVVIAPSHHVIVTGRLWATSMERLAVGMAAVSEGGNDVQFVVLDKRGVADKATAVGGEGATTV